MIYIRRFKYEYSDEQYADTDLTSQDLVEAEYVRVPGYEGNPDIEALPLPLFGRELLNAETEVPDILTKEGAYPAARTAALRSLRIPLFNQGLIDEQLYQGIVSSYAVRRYGKSRHQVRVVSENNEASVSILSSSYGAAMVSGSAVIGMPGTGKSTAISMSEKRYPKAIRHRTDDGWYIQVPIIRTTAYSCSNLSSLFQSFARRLDEILDTGRCHIESLPSTNVGRMCGCVIDWIQRYHIGAWIIEEISFFSFAPGSSKSFENVVTIMSETGVFIMATGNPDIYDKIHRNLRIERRILGSFIDMDEVSQDKSYMLSLTRKIWTAYMLPELVETYSNDIFEIIYKWTLGSIDMITLLLCAVQTAWLRARRKNKQALPSEIITAETVEDLAEKNLSRMRKLFKDGRVKSVTEYRELRNKLDGMYQDGANEEIQKKAEMKALITEDIESGFDHATKLHMVKSAVSDMFDYTDKQIEAAFCYCEKHTPDFKKLSDKQMKRAVLGRLESRRKQKNTADKAKAQQNTSEMLADLQEVMG